MASDYDKYLKNKLKQIQLDENVFGDYIRGILSDQISDEEKTEALEDVLAGVLESDLKEFINEIINKWNECHRKAENEKPAEKPPEVDMEDRLVKLMGAQKLSTNQVRQYTEEEKKIRDQILSQYSQTAVEEDDEPLDSDDGGDPTMAKNTNAAVVQAQIREKREAAKLESQMKKQKDKEDREKQKKDREEKKEKRKTVKGERRR